MAQSLFQEALAQQPDMAESYFNLGNLERRRGNSHRALNYLKKCTQSVPRGSSSPGTSTLKKSSVASTLKRPLYSEFFFSIESVPTRQQIPRHLVSKGLCTVSFL